MNETPLYETHPSGRSLWQRYRVYSDRIEIQAWFRFHTYVIPSDQILGVEVRPPLVFADLFRGKNLAFAFPLKLDWVDLFRNVALHRQSGFMRHLRFTPNDAKKFVAACETMLNRRK